MRLKKITLFCFSAVLLLALAAPGWGATTNFYVDSNVTSYSGDGTTPALNGTHAAWGFTDLINWTAVANAVAAATNPGDYVAINFNGNFNWYLPVQASGTPGHKLIIRPYPAGTTNKLTTPPTFDGAVPTSGGWTNRGNNVWSKNIGGDGAAWVRFNGSQWGYLQASSAAIAYPRDWYYQSSSLYVYAPSGSGGPDSYYSGVAYVTGPGYAWFDITNQSYIDVQGFIIKNLGGKQGFYVRGNSDHIGIYTCAIDGITPDYAGGINIYNNSATDIKIYNNDLTRCYIGCVTQGSVTDFANNRVYFNRSYGLQCGGINTTFGYNHFAYNGMDTNTEKSVEGGTDGGHNLAGTDNLYQSIVDPAIKRMDIYPPYVGIRVDDPELIYDNTYLNLISEYITAAAASQMAFTHGIVTYDLLQAGQTSSLLGWANAGIDLVSHSWSHTSLGATQGFGIRYNSGATTATVTISGTTLTTNVNGVVDLTLDLTVAPYNILADLVNYLNTGTNGHYSAALPGGSTQPGMHTISLANQTHDIRSPYTLTIDAARLANDETLSSKHWLDANVGAAGYSCTSIFYAGNLNPASETPAISAGYLQSCGGQCVSTNQVLSYGVPTYEIPNVYPYPASWGDLSQTQKDAFVRSFVVRSKVWGVPYTLQTHPGSESLVDFSGIVSALAKTQGFAKTLTQMGTYLRGLDPQRTTTSYSGPTTGILDMTPTSSSPTINAGVAVGLTTDILGNPITGIPDIGAYKYQGVTNTQPVVTITSPPNGSTFSYNSVINFSGTATDTQSGDLSSIIAWSSNIDGNLGIGSSLSRVLSPGTHTITASVTDLGGLIGTATITLTVNNNTPPVVTINSPANGSTFPAGTAILFMGTATDTESGNLTASLTWTSSIDGSIGSGGSFSKTLSSGTHTITASVTDPGGLIGRATVNITVGQSNTPPVVTIVSPTNGATFASGAVISFSGTATDTESGNLTDSLTWTSSRDGSIGSGGSFSRTLSSGTHTITASVTDPGGLIGTKTVNITVSDTPPVVAEFGYHPSNLGSLTLDYWSKGYLAAHTTAVSANPASSGTLTSISLWCKQYSGASTLHVAIYADNAGSPGALLAQDAGGTAIGSSEGWVTVPITCAISANTPYWLSYYGSNGVYVRSTSATGGMQADTTTSHIGIWQNPFYVDMSYPAIVAMYATYNQN